MRDQRNPAHAMMCTNETDGLLELTACIVSAAQRGVLLRRLRYLWIWIGEAAEAVEVEPPAMKPGCRQFITPRDAVEPTGYGQSRRKSSAMYVKHDVLVRLRFLQCWQVAEKQ